MSKLFKIFGVVKDDSNNIEEFNGEIFAVNNDGEFLHNNKTFKPHVKQTEAVEFLYPTELWIKEPRLREDPDNPEEVLIESTQISNCYARRGSHWIRYFIDPSSLTILGEKDEDTAQELAIQNADIIINKASLKTALKRAGITDENVLNDILLCI